MRIAVDVRPLSHPGTGIYRYTRELLLRMCPMGGRWYFYSSQPYCTDDFNLANVTHRMIATPAVLGGSQASQLLFPYWIRRDAIEQFWGPRHHLPLLMPSSVSAVLTVHDLVWRQQGESMPSSRRWAERVLMPRSLRQARHIVTGTQYIAGQLSEYYPNSASKLAVIPYGSRFSPVVAAGEAAEIRSGYFLFVGTSEPRKNLPRLLRAYKAYSSRSDGTRRLRLVGGSGWGGIDPGRMIEDLGLVDRVDVLGLVDDEELSRLYRGAHALVMPSLYEGFGLPVVEALAHGVPVLVSRDSALSEVAGGAGLPVDPLSESDLCGALSRMDSDNALHQRLQAAALPRAAQFNWDSCAEQMYALLRNQT